MALPLASTKKKRHQEDGEQGLFISLLADHPVDVYVVAGGAPPAGPRWRGARYRET